MVKPVTSLEEFKTIVRNPASHFACKPKIRALPIDQRRTRRHFRLHGDVVRPVQAHLAHL